MNGVIKNGLDAAKKNRAPGLVLQGVALALVLLYYFHEPTTQLLSNVPELQKKVGALFPILATSLFGGLIPFIFLMIFKKIPRGERLKELLFMLAFWAFLGLCVDGLYRGLAYLFGDQPDAITVIKKVLFDQFVFSLFFSAPVTTLALAWKSHNFSIKKTHQNLSGAFFTNEMPSILIAMWAVWLPTVAVIYCLPVALQFPLFNIVLCFWSLLLCALDKPSNADAA